MTRDIPTELRQDTHDETSARLECARKAFHMLAKLDKLHTLDVGCGWR